MTMNHKSTLAAVFGGALLAGSLLAPTAQAATPLTPDGWAAAIIGPTGKTTGRQLVMVSPTGAQYTVRSVGASWHVLQLSKDGRKVLLIGVTPDDQYRYAVVDRTRNTWTSVGVDPIRWRSTSSVRPPSSSGPRTAPWPGGRSAPRCSPPTG